MRRSIVLFAMLIGCGSSTGKSDGGGSNCMAGQVLFDKVCVTTPTAEAARTQCGDVTEYCDKSGASSPVLRCLTAAPGTRPATPAKVTLTGFVHPFSGGTSNSPVVIQILREADLAGGADPTDATKVTPIATVTIGFDRSTATDPTQFRACDKDPKVGCIAVTPDACVAPVCNDGLPNAMGALRMDDKKYCHTVNGAAVCSDRLRWEPRYAIDNIPTNTPLVIRTTGANGTDVWATLVQWNVFLATDDRSCSGDALATDCLDTHDMAKPKYQLNVNVISTADYTNIPYVAGLANGISPNEGAIAGEIHDCDNIRIGGAQVGTLPSGDRFTYFNGNPFNTLPDSGRVASGTDRLGLYSSLNVAPGAAVVEAVGIAGGKQVSLGRYTAQVYAGAVSVVNLNGGKPPQP